MNSDCQSNSLATSESQYNCPVSSDSHMTSQVSQSSIISHFNQSSVHMGQLKDASSFGLNINQNFEDFNFESDIGKTLTF